MADDDGDRAPLTLFLRPPIPIEARGVTGVRVHLDTLLPAAEFTVDGNEGRSLEQVLHTIAQKRTHQTRRATETVAAYLYVTIPATDTHTLFIPWDVFVQRSTAVTPLRCRRSKRP